jgi:hypothetical protein
MTTIGCCAFDVLTDGERTARPFERQLDGLASLISRSAGLSYLKASADAESLLTLFLPKGDRRWIGVNSNKPPRLQNCKLG